MRRELRRGKGHSRERGRLRRRVSARHWPHLEGDDRRRGEGRRLRPGRGAPTTAHSSTEPRDYGVFESTCAVLHACWPRALPSFARAYAFNKGVDAKTVATIALRRLAPTKLELSDKAGGVSCVARACLLHIAGHTRVATWMLLTGVRCVNDPEAALNEMMERCARVNADDAGDEEKEKSGRAASDTRPTLVRGGRLVGLVGRRRRRRRRRRGAHVRSRLRGFRRFLDRSGGGRERPGKELRSTPLGWRLATELLRACASIDDVEATADVFDVLRASFTASAGAASAWSAQSPRRVVAKVRVRVPHPRRRQKLRGRRGGRDSARRRGPRRLSWPPRGWRRGAGPAAPSRRLRAPLKN